MDNREAKFILNAYRPGGQDANDPRFAEALDQARRDPTLQRWFDESVAFDAAITEKLCAVPVHRDLRENILAGVKVSRPLQWSKPFIRWAIAAMLVLSATLGSLIWHNARPTRLAGWQSEALEVISSLVRNRSSFDAQSRSSADLINWLHANHAPAAENIPDNLSKLASIGCKTFSWNGTPVSVICFMRPDGGLVHFVATNATSTTTSQVTAKPSVVKRGDWATATWREGDKIYMIALEGSLDQLRSYLS
jgi:hypothetical protein